MPCHPHARDARLFANNLDPGVNVAGIVFYRHCVGVGGGARTAKHAAFVDADGGYAPLGKALGKELVRRSFHAEPIVAVAVGGTRAGNNQDGGVARCRAKHCPAERTGMKRRFSNVRFRSNGAACAAIA